MAAQELDPEHSEAPAQSSYQHSQQIRISSFTSSQTQVNAVYFPDHARDALPASVPLSTAQLHSLSSAASNRVHHTEQK